MRKSATTLTLLVILTILSGCKSINVTGNNIKEEDINYIKTHKLTKDKVIDRIGSPTITADYSPNIWYYVYIKTAKTTWTLPKIVEQKILKITFNNSNVVENVSITDNTYNNDVQIIANSTPTPGTEESVLQEFVKNIGKFNKSHKKKN